MAMTNGDSAAMVDREATPSRPTDKPLQQPQAIPATTLLSLRSIRAATALMGSADTHDIKMNGIDLSR